MFELTVFIGLVALALHNIKQQARIERTEAVVRAIVLLMEEEEQDEDNG